MLAPRLYSYSLATLAAGLSVASTTGLASPEYGLAVQAGQISAEPDVDQELAQSGPFGSAVASARWPTAYGRFGVGVGVIGFETKASEGSITEEMRVIGFLSEVTYRQTFWQRLVVGAAVQGHTAPGAALRYDDGDEPQTTGNAVAHLGLDIASRNDLNGLELFTEAGAGLAHPEDHLVSYSAGVHWTLGKAARGVAAPLAQATAVDEPRTTASAGVAASEDPADKMKFQAFTYRSAQAKLDADGEAAAKALAEALLDVSDHWETLTVQGHAASDGRFSKRHAAARAENVGQLLVKYGIPADRIAVVGLGATQPLPDFAPDAAEQRRVEIEIDGIDDPETVQNVIESAVPAAF